MGRSLPPRTTPRRRLALLKEFFGYEPATDTTAARLTVVHLWSGLPYGPNPRKRRYAVSAAVIIGPEPVVGKMPFVNFKEAEERFDMFCGGLEATDGVLTGDEVTIITARDHLEQATGTRFWRCASCDDTLRIAALWCEACGAPSRGDRITAAQHAERAAAAS